VNRLYTYQCRNCLTVATSPVYHDKIERPLCCIYCHCYMQFKWSDPITTDEQRRLAQMGPVWDPGTIRERHV